MSMVAQCPLCGAYFKARKEYAGKRVRCPQCQGIIQIPLGEASSQPVISLTPGKSATEPSSSFRPPIEQAGEEEKPLLDWEPKTTSDAETPPSVVKPPAVFLPESSSGGAVSSSRLVRRDTVPGGQAVPVWVWILLASVLTGVVVGTVVYAALKISGSGSSGAVAQTEEQKASRKSSADKKKTSSSSGAGASEGGTMQSSSGQSKPSKTIREVLQAVVKLETPIQKGQMGIGAGFFIDRRGWVATNYHVIAQANSATRVRLFDGTQCKVAGILAQEPSMDLAIVKLADPPPGITLLDISFSGEPELGEEIRVCGHPHNLSFTFVEGTVGRVVTTIELLKERANPLLVQMKAPMDMVWIQHSARIAPGNSGGPVVNKQGQVLGINSFVNELSFGYAVPVRYLRALVALCDESRLTPLSDQPASPEPSSPKESKESPEPSPPSPSEPPSPTPKGPESPPAEPPSKPSPPSPKPTGIPLSPEELQKLYDACCEFYWKPSSAEQYRDLETFARAMSLVKHIQAHPEAVPGASKEAVAACVEKADQLFADLKKSPWTKEHWSAIHQQAAGQLQPGRGALLQGSVVMNAEKIQGPQPTILVAPEGMDQRVLLVVSGEHAKLPEKTKIWILGQVIATAQLSSKEGPTETCPVIQVGYLVREE